MRVMSKICQHSKMFEVEEIQTAGRLCTSGHKACQGRTNIFNRNISVQISSQHSRQTVLNIMYSLSFICERYIFYGHHSYFPGTLHDADITIFENSSEAPLGAMPLYPRIMFVHAKQSDITFEIILHLIHQIIIGIQDGISMREYSFRHNCFYFSHLLQCINSAQSHMIGGHIGDNSDLTILKR